jgi:hypothetical protein
MTPIAAMTRDAARTAVARDAATRVRVIVLPLGLLNAVVEGAEADSSPRRRCRRPGERGRKKSDRRNRSGESTD